MRLLTSLCMGSLLLCASAMAQFAHKNGASVSHDNAPPAAEERIITQAPSFDTSHLVIFTPAGGHHGQQWGIDPQTITLSQEEGIVRYIVVVKTPSGLVNAMYEGIRCNQAQHKTYARYLGSQPQWAMIKEPLWQPLQLNPTVRHALSLARMGLCDGVTLPRTVKEAVISIASGGLR